MSTLDHIASNSILTGVVLMGGRSRRMGIDKSSIAMDGLLLYQRAAEKLKPFCNQVILSVNNSQIHGRTYEYPIVIDQVEEEGPMAGILSCFEAGFAPLLILAVDLINIKSKNIEKLLTFQTSNDAICSMYYSIKNQRYEPMLSLWTKLGLQKLKTSFDQGERSFQRFLKNENVDIYNIEDESTFININTIDEFSSWVASD